MITYLGCNRGGLGANISCSNFLLRWGDNRHLNRGHQRLQQLKSLLHRVGLDGEMAQPLWDARVVAGHLVACILVVTTANHVGMAPDVVEVAGVHEHTCLGRAHEIVGNAAQGGSSAGRVDGDTARGKHEVDKQIDSECLLVEEVGAPTTHAGVNFDEHGLAAAILPKHGVLCVLALDMEAAHGETKSTHTGQGVGNKLGVFVIGVDGGGVGGVFEEVRVAGLGVVVCFAVDQLTVPQEKINVEFITIHEALEHHTGFAAAWVPAEKLVCFHLLLRCLEGLLHILHLIALVHAGRCRSRHRLEHEGEPELKSSGADLLQGAHTGIARHGHTLLLAHITAHELVAGSNVGLGGVAWEVQALGNLTNQSHGMLVGREHSVILDPSGLGGGHNIIGSGGIIAHIGKDGAGKQPKFLHGVVHGPVLGGHAENNVELDAHVGHKLDAGAHAGPEPRRVEARQPEDVLAFGCLHTGLLGDLIGGICLKKGSNIDASHFDYL
eukprot:comp21452_c0_seq1/m.29637 comp21452_c0_seq1/g.29637  ORF comp21452_c0_seq1/g.29637 comp21452_c0_seq1/m.29637 type:complete len:495 (+) comp21452_c0_seq1:251-1735(+)